MKQRTFFTLILLVATVASAGWALVESTQRRKEGEQASFERRRLELAEAENERLRTMVDAHRREEHEARQSEARKEIEETTAALRGLAFKKPVDYATLSRKDVKKVLLEKIAEHYSDDEFRSIEVGYQAMGLIPEGYDLKNAYINLLGEQIAAFYDQHAHRLYMFDDVSLDNAQNRVILSHELVHALQDQHYVLKNLPLEMKTNDDRVIAASSLIEGDATLLMNEFMLGEASMKTLTDTLAGMFAQSFKELQAAPRLLRETLLFPYTEGLKFCTALMERKGRRGIDEAFARVPSSSAQILHPEKYFAGEEPISVDWPQVSFQGKTPISDNVLGELGTRVLLADWSDLGEAEAASVAAGWRGDRYLVFELPGAPQGASRRYGTLWRTIWAGPTEQNRFTQAMKAVWAKRYQATVNEPEGDLPTRRVVFRSPERHLLMLVLPGSEVLLVDAPDEASADALAKAFEER